MQQFIHIQYRCSRILCSRAAENLRQREVGLGRDATIRPSSLRRSLPETISAIPETISQSVSPRA